jgi:MraZ protein
MPSEDEQIPASDQNGRESVDLHGEYRFKVDAKGRVALPSKFRKALPGSLVVSRELTDDCLYVFEPEAFNQWVNGLFNDKFGGYKSSNRQHVKLRTALKSRADDVEMDKAGRIMLTPKIREAVGIDHDVVIVGNEGYFEIWDAAKFDSMMDDTDLSVLYDLD